MEFEMRDLAVFVYTLGVIATGLSLGAGGQPEVTPFVMAGAAALSAGWTVYFKWKLAPQFLEPGDEDGDGPGTDGDGPGTDGDRPGTDGDSDGPPDRPAPTDDVDRTAE